MGADAAAEIGVAVYLPKPFANAAFLDAVRHVLTGWASAPGDVSAPAGDQA